MRTLRISAKLQAGHDNNRIHLYTFCRVQMELYHALPVFVWMLAVANSHPSVMRKCKALLAISLVTAGN